MRGIMIPVIFALCTAVCWGMYGPTLGNARSPLKEWSPFKPYVFIGIAYLVWACAGGLIAMKVKGDTYNYGGSHSPAMTWGFLAGTLGALGALGLTTAIVSGGRPAYVMPIVFGGAVSVNALIAWYNLRGQAVVISPLMWIGMLLVAVGIVLVASHTPHGPPPTKASAPAEAHVQNVDTVPSESSS
ncbi:MAG: hypothetical protein ACF8TS_16845 [Maioricimonas sp. JB049]